MNVGTFRVRRLVPVAALATIACVAVPVSGAARQAGVCDQAIAEAGTGQGTFGGYELIQAPEKGGSGSQVVVGTAGPDRLLGGSGNDVLCGLGGDDVLLGGSGDDHLDGGDGSDVLHGGSGHDHLDGAAGFDRHFGGSGNDTLRNGEVNEGGSGQNQTVPTPTPTPTPAAPPVDISARMPRTQRDELTWDFLARGYDQRMRAEDSNLNIYDAASRGGALLHSTPMDLALVPPSGVAFLCSNIFGCNAQPWADYGQESTQSCEGCFGAYWNVFHLNTIYLARNDTNIFMAGTKGNAFEPTGDQIQYQNLLYVLPGDGSCASQSCAISTISLPIAFNLCDTCPGEPRVVHVTSLAAGYVSGTPYVAVGLSDGGVQIYALDGLGELQRTGTFTGMGTSDGSQTPVTAMAWDPSGSGLLAVGVISWENVGFVVRINANGSIPGRGLTWSQQGRPSLSPGVLSAAFGQRQDGTPVVAFGSNDGMLRLIDPTATGMTNTLAQSQPVNSLGNGIVAINPIPRFDGSTGGSDFAVSYRRTEAPGFLGYGGLLRWDGTSANLTALPVSAGSPNTVTADWDSFRRWYPGIKQGRLQVSNTSGEPITVTLHAASDSASGCWYAPSWADAPAFPTAGITVAAGQTSAIHTMGAYTAGTDGNCAATNNTDIWRGYLVITPVNHPADASLVRLRLNQNMTVDVTNQAGGTTTVSISQAPQHLAAFGLWTVVVDTPAALIPESLPTVTGSRITPAGMPGPAVYRLDVTGGTFQLLNPYANQLAVPPLIVQGSVDGATWTDLGTLVPATAPTIVQRFGGSQLQVGPATFWWENPTGQPAYEFIQVALGPAGDWTFPVFLADLPAPAAVTNASGPQVAATSSTGIAAPVDSGIDQAPLSVQVLGTASNVLPISDPSYQRIYYREVSTNALITNLFPTSGDVNTFIGVSPHAGAYANNGSAGGGPPGTFDGYHYVATTSTIDQKISGYLGINSNPPAFSQDIEVHGSAIAPVNNTTSAANGISLAGCQDFAPPNNTCRLAQITTNSTTGALTPAMYLDTASGIQIGLLTAASAATAVSSLPLQHANGTAEHLLASAPLTVSATAATLTETSAFQASDRVDTNLVTHGMLVPVVDIPVQAG